MNRNHDLPASALKAEPYSEYSVPRYVARYETDFFDSTMITMKHYSPARRNASSPPGKNKVQKTGRERTAETEEQRSFHRDLEWNIEDVFEQLRR